MDVSWATPMRRTEELQADHREVAELFGRIEELPFR